MKRKCVSLLLAVVMVLAMLPGTAWAAEKGKTIHVSTIEELTKTLSEIYSVQVREKDLTPVTIVLAEGDYLMNYTDEELKDKGEEKDGSTLYLHSLSNITLKGTGTARLLSGSSTDTVIDIKDCTNITLSGLIMGHEILSTDYCSAGVIDISNSSVSIVDCDIFGCGYVGIVAFSGSSISVENSVIRDCSDSIMSISNSNSTFNDCTFSGNGYLDPRDCAIWLQDSSGLHEAPAPDGKTSAIFTGCTFTNNKNPYLYNDPNEPGTHTSAAMWENIIISFENCTFSGNEWEKSHASHNVDVRMHNCNANYMVSAKTGATITMTVKPNPGYETAYVMVYEIDNNRFVDVTKQSDGTYTFIMPDSDVTIWCMAWEKNSSQPGSNVENPVFTAKATYGTISTYQYTAKAGEQVEVAVLSDQNHEVESLTITTIDGKPVAFTKLSDEEYAVSQLRCTFTMPDAPVLVQATFKDDKPLPLDVYPVIVPKAHNGTITASPTTAKAGEMVTLTVEPDQGFRLSNLSLSSDRSEVSFVKQSEETYTFTMPDSRVTVYPSFGYITAPEENEVYIFSNMPYDRAIVLPGPVKVGETVTVIVKPNQGYELDTLTAATFDGNVKGTAVPAVKQNNGTYTFIMPDSDVMVELVFKKADSSQPDVGTPNPVVAIQPPHGSLTASPDSAKAGETVTLTVKPEQGYELDDLGVTAAFDGTTVTAVKQGDGTYTFTMPDDAVIVGAMFKKTGSTQPDVGTASPVTVTQASHGSVTASSASAKAGDKVTLTATPEQGYELSALTVTDAGGEAVATSKQSDGTYTFTMPASAVTVRASFQAVEQSESGFSFDFEFDTSAMADHILTIKIIVYMNGIRLLDIPVELSLS